MQRRKYDNSGKVNWKRYGTEVSYPSIRLQ